MMLYLGTMRFEAAVGEQLDSEQFRMPGMCGAFYHRDERIWGYMKRMRILSAALASVMLLTAMGTGIVYAETPLREDGHIEASEQDTADQYEPDPEELDKSASDLDAAAWDTDEQYIFTQEISDKTGVYDADGVLDYPKLDAVTDKNLDTAAAYVREQMLKRESTIKVEIVIGDTEYSKMVYDMLFERVFAYTGKGDEGDYLDKARDYISGFYGVTKVDGEIRWNATLLPTYKTSASQEREVAQKVKTVLGQLDMANDGEYEKVRKIYDFIVNNVRYDYDHLSDNTYLLQYTAYAALIHGKAVCQGYAMLFYLMTHEAGIPSRIITGESNGGEHAWNIVRIGSQYYCIDVTFASTGYNQDRYFLKGSMNFTDHEADEQFKGEDFIAAFPISPTDYDISSPNANLVCTLASACEGTMLKWDNFGNADSYSIYIWKGPRSGDPYKTVSGIKNGSRTIDLAAGTYVAMVEAVNRSERIDGGSVTFTVKNDHRYTATTVDPTCEDEGYTLHECRVCHKIYKDKQVSALGHSWGTATVITEATASAEGSMKYKCSQCGEERTVVIPRLNSGVVNPISTEIFVSNLYRNYLGRKADASGLKAWVDALVSHKATGSKVVYNFVYSDEFQNKPLENEEFVNAMYDTVLERKADANGLKAWVTVLENGCTRKKVLSGFLNSDEMKVLCGRMGIDPGTYHSDDIVDQNSKVTYFVSRMYRCCLGRNADKTGLAAWVSALLDKRATGSKIATGFFFSDEMKKKNLSNRDFVANAYVALLDREPDEGGLTAWTRVLDNGVDRRKVVEGFIDSPEFTNLCQDYGILR